MIADTDREPAKIPESVLTGAGIFSLDAIRLQW
jgi:hypothetical protein